MIQWTLFSHNFSCCRNTESKMANEISINHFLTKPNICACLVPGPQYYASVIRFGSCGLGQKVCPSQEPEKWENWSHFFTNPISSYGREFSEHFWEWDLAFSLMLIGQVKLYSNYLDPYKHLLSQRHRHFQTTGKSWLHKIFKLHVTIHLIRENKNVPNFLTFRFKGKL